MIARLAILVAAVWSIGHAADKRPNIVFLLADDVNRDTLGAYGSVDCRTPHIDKLAREGLLFERAYCSVAMCAPFRQELYSGRTPWRTGTLPNHSKSTPETRSIAHYLKPLGYRTVLLGKSHVGPRQAYPFEYLDKAGKAADKNPYFIDQAAKIMAQSKESGKPFCLFVASNDGHSPYTTGDRSVYDADKLTIPPYWLDTPELRKVLVTYYAEISNFDVLVGGIRAELEKQGLWDNTIFMVCSEQGTGLPFAKWTCYDNGLRTGLVAHWPGLGKPGQRIGQLVSIADVTPSLVEAVGGKLKQGDVDGKSFLPLLQGREFKGHDFVYGAFTNCNITGNQDRIYPIRVVRSERYTLIYNPNFKHQTSNVTLDQARAMLADPDEKPKVSDASYNVAGSWVELSRKNPSARPLVHKLHHRPEYELYDLEKDPHELRNLIDDPAHAETARGLKAALHAWLEKVGDADPMATEKSLVKKK